MFIYSFEKLEAWQLSKLLNKELYNMTREFPDEERFGLISQIRRATISVSSNRVEGVNTPKAQANYSEIAFGSLMEGCESAYSFLRSRLEKDVCKTWSS